MNVLILGAGYVGTEIYNQLPKDKHNIYLKSRKDLDYHNQGVLRRFIGNNDIHYVINCSGFTGRPNVDEGEIRKQDCWRLNVEIPLLIEESCKTIGVDYIHISSGCIYAGYEKEWTEEDEPNFGMFNESSFYSKTKHAYERLNRYGLILRVRMPVTDDASPRNYLTKIYKYDNIINYRNSKTHLSDLGFFIEHIISRNMRVSNIGPLNFVHPEARDTQYIVDRMKVYKIENKNWKFVDVKDLDIVAPRSNCVLSTAKLSHLFPDFYMRPEDAMIEESLSNIKF